MDTAPRYCKNNDENSNKDNGVDDDKYNDIDDDKNNTVHSIAEKCFSDKFFYAKRLQMGRKGID